MQHLPKETVAADGYRATCPDEGSTDQCPADTVCKPIQVVGISGTVLQRPVAPPVTVSALAVPPASFRASKETHYLVMSKLEYGDWERTSDRLERT